MKTNLQRRPAPTGGFTLVEVLISITVLVSVLAMTMSTFLFGLRTMYKDTIRLQTNAAMRYFTAQMAKETVDSSEFYLFENHKKLDASTDIDASDGASDMAIVDGTTTLASGDCIVLVTRTNLTTGAKVRQIRIYFRVVTADTNGDSLINVSDEGSIRYYESPDWGTTGSTSSLDTLVNAIDLSTNANFAATGAINRMITAKAKGRKSESSSAYFPVFCSDNPYVTPTNQSFSINVEFINGNSVINMVSSSSFNYTVSPRR